MRLLVGYCDVYQCEVVQGTTIHLSLPAFLKVHNSLYYCNHYTSLHRTASWSTVAKGIKILHFIDILEWFIALSPGSHRETGTHCMRMPLIMSLWLGRNTRNVY